MRARRAPVAVALLAALSFISACSGSDGAAEPSTTAATTSAATETASTSPASSSVGASITASSPASSVPTASSLVQPTLTTEQIEAYTGAMAAVSNYFSTVDQAFATPDQDWSAQLSKVAADPLLSEIEDQLKKNSDGGTRILGQVALDYSVPMAGPVNVEVGSDGRSVVTLALCVDASDQEFVNAAGEKTSDAFGAYPRIPTTMKIAKFPDQGWLVGYHDPDDSKTC